MPYQLPTELEAKVREALRAIADAELICQKARDAGFDVQAQQAACAHYRDVLTKTLQHFGRKSAE